MGDRINFGRWQTKKRLGSGGQGVVFLAKEGVGEDPQARLENELGECLFKFSQTLNPGDRQVLLRRVISAFRDIASEIAAERDSRVGALKAIHESSTSALKDQAALRLEQEVRVLGKVHHPSLIRILDSNVPEKWFVMEYFPAGPLYDTTHNHLGDTKGNVSASLIRARPLVEAVAALHHEGFVHRDIKPQNIFMSQANALVLADCGLVFDANDGGIRVTLSEEKVGTTDFMPPWAMGSMRAADVRPSFDVFSLGKLIWCLISGKPVLRLWYHHDEEHPELDIERLFPNEPSTVWARRLFDKCIVQRERDCLATASDLLREIDATIEALRYGSQIPSPDKPLLCRVCGLGSYVSARAGPQSEITLVCGNCGHFQRFVGVGARPFWKEFKPPS